MFWLILLGIFILVQPASARITGVPCGDCHTMHYSQNGEILSDWGKTGPYKALVVKDCVGCHTGTNIGSNKIPYILSLETPYYGNTGTEVNTNTLAGGNFYWVQNDDAKGHNVKGIAPQIDKTWETVPPGGTDMEKQITCAGKYGCHGNPSIEGDFDSLLGAHHARDNVIDGSTVGKSYRFLYQVVGYEDSDWEYQPTSREHNQYKGVDRSNDTQIDSSTISALCARCHGDFHQDVSSSSWGSPWLRHPIDYDMGNTKPGSEYRNYPGNYGPGPGSYSVIAPVASEDVSAPKETVSFSNDTIVTCVSCHRAHGTPYPRLLRWDYFNWPGGTTINGCNACHTTKD